MKTRFRTQIPVRFAAPSAATITPDMADLPTPAQITSLISLLAPGLIISAVRTRAVTGSLPDFKERLLSYGVVSTAYFAAVTPLFHVPGGIALPRWLWNLLQFFMVPVSIGIATAYAYQHHLIYRVAGRIGLHLAHHLPASWDYAFEQRRDDSFLIVTLKDGTQVAGLWGRGSFASSSREERDLLISRFGSRAKRGSHGPLPNRVALS